jgi:nucleolar protein 58
MLILFETPAGYALFKVLDPSKLEEVGDLYQYFNDPENASKTVKLAAMYKFKDSAEALKSVAKTIKGKMPKTLKKFLQENIISKEISDNLQCEEKKLASTISQKLGIDCQSNEQSLELIRGIRFQMNSLLKGISENDMKAMSLGLAHSLSRYKLKFSAEKVDVMIIHATSLLDDIDKELNNYNMRLKEWYSWHFPELSEIVTDNLVYSKIAQKLGIRTNIHKISLTDIVTEEISNEIAEAVELSMGTEILPQDEVNIKNLAGQIIELTQYRDALGEYLKNRMMAIAPNLSAMVGEIVGSKLIAKAGSLMNLAK